MARRHGAEPVDSPRDAQLRAQRERARAWREEHDFDPPEEESWPVGADGRLPENYYDCLYEG
jgi:hypothetical protein